jgi:hypothetical protein
MGRGNCALAMEYSLLQEDRRPEFGSLREEEKKAGKVQKWIGHAEKAGGE